LVRSGALLSLAFEPRAMGSLVLFCPCRARDKFCLLFLPPKSSLFPPPEFSPAHELVRRPAVLAQESCPPVAISISCPELHLRSRSSVFCKLDGLASASTRGFSFQGCSFVSAQFLSSEFPLAAAHPFVVLQRHCSFFLAVRKLAASVIFHPI
jgi:hypothetical protein